VERTMPEAHIFQPSALVDQFDRAITAELDFTQEAEHAKRFALNFVGHPHARFPFVYREASSKRVLTMERLEGYKIHSAVAEHGFAPRAVAKEAAGIIIKMIFEDGFFHADPHPGNILLGGDPAAPVFGLFDLGMVGRLSPEMRDKTIDLMLAATRKDHEAMADALYAIGTPTKKVDMRAFRAEVARLSEKYLHRPLQEVDLAALIADLVHEAGRFGLEIPSDFLLVGKALMTVEGIAKEVAPDLDFMAEARPYFVDMVRKRYAPERLAGDLWRGLQRIGGAAVDLPQQLREVMDDLRDGRLVVQASDPASARALERLGKRICLGLFASACVLAAAWLLVRAPDERVIGLGLLGLGCVVGLWQLLAPGRGP
jgi:ubiquinone biosynthesis protein